MPRPNWFLAFPVDGAFVRGLPAPPEGFRLFPAEDVHLTLVFLGGCGETAARKAYEALDAALTATPRAPIPVSLAEVVPLGGSRKHYTALSALLGQGTDETSRLTAELRDDITEAAGLPRQTRPPKPHVTLGRPKRRADALHRQAALDWASGLDVRAVHATLDRIALYTWSEDRRERLFRIVLERALG